MYFKISVCQMFYVYARGLMAPFVQLSPLKSPEGTLYVNDFNKANAFNKFFYSILLLLTMVMHLILISAPMLIWTV